MVLLMVLLALGAVLVIMRLRPGRDPDPGQIPHVQIGLRCLLKLRLSTICSRAYAECRRRSLPLATFRLFVRPVVFIAEPNALQQVMSDWRSFRNRGSYHNDPCSMENMHLFNLQDDQWKAARKELGKCFTTEKLKHVLAVFNSYAGECLPVQAECVIDIFELAHRYSHSVAGHVFLSQDTSATTRRTFDKLYNPGWFNKFVDVFGYVCPRLLRRFNVCDIPAEVFAHLRDGVRQALAADGDNSCSQAHCLPAQLIHDCTHPDQQANHAERVVGYMIGLFVGSLKATTTFIAYACYELAKAPHLQQRVYEEMLAVLRDDTRENNNQHVEYKDLKDMTFMRHVLDETLRLHSGGPLIIRECNNATTLSVGALSKVHIASGTLIFGSVRDILRDERFFPAALTFNPDRFDDLAQGQQGPQGSMNFSPFGNGRHTCIGNKFVLLQAQVFLVRLLSEFKITLNGQCEQERLESHNQRLTDGDIYLNLTPRRGDIN